MFTSSTDIPSVIETEIDGNHEPVGKVWNDRYISNSQEIPL